MVADSLDFYTIGFGRTNVGVVIFGRSVRSAFYLNRYTNRVDVKNAILALRYIGGSTNTADAIRNCRNEQFIAINGARTGVDRVAILITAGRSSQSDVIREADDLKRRDVTIYTIGVDRASESEIRQISSDPQRRDVQYYLEEAYARIATALSRIESQVCPSSEYCTITGEAGRICFCNHGGCNIRSINGTLCEGNAGLQGTNICNDIRGSLRVDLTVIYVKHLRYSDRSEGFSYNILYTLFI